MSIKNSAPCYQTDFSSNIFMAGHETNMTRVWLPFRTPVCVVTTIQSINQSITLMSPAGNAASP